MKQRTVIMSYSILYLVAIGILYSIFVIITGNFVPYDWGQWSQGTYDKYAEYDNHFALFWAIAMIFATSVYLIGIADSIRTARSVPVPEEDDNPGLDNYLKYLADEGFWIVIERGYTDPRLMRVTMAIGLEDNRLIELYNIEDPKDLFTFLRNGEQILRYKQQTPYNG